MNQQEARQHIGKLFRKRIDKNVSGIAAEECLAQNLARAATLCQQSHDVLSERLWSKFEYDWSNVLPNPGGTAGLASQFVYDKLEFTLAWATSKGKDSVQVLHTEKIALEGLQALWKEWAGYMVTSSEELDSAV
ncbi:MAG: hypothetical protein ACRCYY_09710 [Trueperaceae bacterium]